MCRHLGIPIYHELCRVREWYDGMRRWCEGVDVGTTMRCGRRCKREQSSSDLLVTLFLSLVC